MGIKLWNLVSAFATTGNSSLYISLRRRKITEDSHHVPKVLFSLPSLTPIQQWIHWLANLISSGTTDILGSFLTVKVLTEYACAGSLPGLSLLLQAFPLFPFPQDIPTTLTFFEFLSHLFPTSGPVPRRSFPLIFTRFIMVLISAEYRLLREVFDY